jgi:hypothetical protein
MTSVVTLKRRLRDAEAQNEFMRSLLYTFFTGDVPPGPSYQHLILAKWGRKRLDEMRAQPALLHTSTS